MRRILSFLIILSIFLLSSCANTFNSTTTFVSTSSNKTIDNTITTSKEIIKNDYKIKTASSIDESYLYKNMLVSVDELNIPVYNCKTNFSQVYNATAPNRMNNAVAIVELDGACVFSITTTFKISKLPVVRPLSANITPSLIDEYHLEFVISAKGQYTIEFTNDRTIHLFVNGYEEYESYKEANNIMYFGPGVHNSTNDKRISSSNKINLSSNTTVFIDEGAIIEAGFVSNNTSNIKIIGYGVVSGSVFDRNANTGTVTIPYDFNFCNNIEFYGITTLDPAGWCYNIYFCDNVKLDNIKIISSRSNGDGVSLQSSKNVYCSNSFVRSWDDSLVVKNYPKWSDRNIEGETRNIYFDNCILWTDLAQSMEIGYETVGCVMDNINFNNITVLHNYHKAVISIHNGNNANITNVTYKDIVVEDASMGRGDGKNILFELTVEFSSTWSQKQKTTSLGSIDTVLIENVTIIEANNPEISIRGSYDSRSGYESYHYVNNITFRNVILSNKKISSSYENYNYKYANNIKFE